MSPRTFLVALAFPLMGFTSCTSYSILFVRPAPAATGLVDVVALGRQFEDLEATIDKWAADKKHGKRECDASRTPFCRLYLMYETRIEIRLDPQSNHFQIHVTDQRGKSTLSGTMKSLRSALSFESGWLIANQI
jgi:hypothetical protein